MFVNVAAGSNVECHVNAVDEPPTFGMFEVDTIYDWLPTIGHASVQYHPSSSLK